MASRPWSADADLKPSLGQTCCNDDFRRARCRIRFSGHASVGALQAVWSAITHTEVRDDAFACEHLADSLATAIRIGHDTDTVAAIAGSMLGARWGMTAVPAQWRRILHGWPGVTGKSLEKMAVLTVRGGKTAKYGWPKVDHIDYAHLQWGEAELAPHLIDEGAWLSGAPALDDMPDGVDAVVSLCLTGRRQVPTDVEHVGLRLMDEADPAYNPNLDFVVVDAARTVAQLRDEGKTVLLHCVAAHSRTPTVGIAYAVLRGVPLAEASEAVYSALPTADANPGFRAALARLEPALRSAGGKETA